MLICKDNNEVSKTNHFTDANGINKLNRFEHLLNRCFNNPSKNELYNLIETILSSLEEIIELTTKQDSYLEQYQWMLTSALNETSLHIKKNNDYGSSNVSGFGIKGIIVRLWDKMCRIMNLYGYKIEDIKIVEVQPKKASNESIEDTFLDMTIYSRIARCILEGHWGK